MKLPDWLEVHVAERPADDELVNGDGSVVVPQGDEVLILVSDGLGHGVEASRATAPALEVARAAAAGTSLSHLLKACERALGRSRGAAISIARLTAPCVEWAGIGNVDAIIRHSDGAAERLLTVGGIVGTGRHPRKVPVRRVPWGAESVLVMATDGLRSDFAHQVRADGTSAREQAPRLLAAHGREHDDALVLVARRREVS